MHIDFEIPKKLLPIFEPAPCMFLTQKKTDDNHGIIINENNNYYQFVFNVKHKLIVNKNFLNKINNFENEQIIDDSLCKKIFDNYISLKYDYIIIYGGRSSAKTATVCRYILLLACKEQNKTIICAREIKASIWLSTYAELKMLIFEYHLEHIFLVKSQSIVCKKSGTEIKFIGLEREGVYSLKSVPNIIACFVEEAEKVTDISWEVLIPTIVRNRESQIIIAFNPKESQSATYQKFITNSNKLAGKVLSIEQNYPDNPFLSEKALSEIEMLRVHDYARYEHIYLGKVLEMSEDVIFKNRFKVEHIEIQYNSIGKFFQRGNQIIKMRYGMDFGFSTDPAALVEVCFLDENTIYIRREIYETKLLPDDYIDRINKNMVESLKVKWYADSARPDTIAQLTRYGLNIEGADKGKGSIQSGLEYLLGKNIIIDPSCTNAIYEFYNYRYKTDKNTGNITTEIIDSNNHLIDAIRYALCKEIQSSKKGLDVTKMSKYLERIRNYA